MKHTRVMLLLLILALLLSACGETSPEPYTYSEGSYSFTVDPANHTITHGADVYTYITSGSGDRIEYTIVYPDGSRYNYGTSGVLSYGGFDPGDNGRYISGMVLVRAIGKGAESQQQQGIDEMLPGLLCGILLILIGIYYIHNPEHLFYMRFGWAVESAQPTEQYYTYVTAGGILLIVSGILAILIAVF